MSILSTLEPKNVFHYFEEISMIPRGSGNTLAISNYCADFAKEHHLEYVQDQHNNIIIIKEASKGYEQAETIIIQGHMDMVCEKDPGVEIDFEKDPLPLMIENGYVTCDGTTLGADDGVAVAFALAVLDDDTLAHPKLEVILTVDEEIGLLGANAIDVSCITGHKLLNLDSDEDGIFLSSCAGGMTADCVLPVSYTDAKGIVCRIKISGLEGGHSGDEIEKEHGNAVVLLGRILALLQTKTDFSIKAISGGLKDNAIPREAIAEICLQPEHAADVEALIKKYDQILKQELAVPDAGVYAEVTVSKEEATQMLTEESTKKVIFFLEQMPRGVQNFSMSIKGLVETSLNPGIMILEKDKFRVCYSVRSSVASRKDDLANRLIHFTEFLGGTVELSGDYPAWEYKADSELRIQLMQTYKDLFGEEPVIRAIHAGLECGLLSDKIENLDCISFGPENLDIHTPKERLSIASTQKYWKLFTTFLANSK